MLRSKLLTMLVSFSRELVGSDAEEQDKGRPHPDPTALARRTEYCSLGQLE